VRYLKHFFVLFLTIFFANYLLPGVDAVSRTKLPFIGGDLLFAIGLALLNAVVYPIVKLVSSGCRFFRSQLCLLRSSEVHSGGYSDLDGGRISLRLCRCIGRGVFDELSGNETAVPSEFGFGAGGCSHNKARKSKL